MSCRTICHTRHMQMVIHPYEYACGWLDAHSVRKTCHILHILNDFSPVWIFMWIVRYLLEWKRCRTLHKWKVFSRILKGRSPIWVRRMWLLRFDFREQDMPHTPQVNGFSPVWQYMWVSRWPFWEKDLSQISHAKGLSTGVNTHVSVEIGHFLRMTCHRLYRLKVRCQRGFARVCWVLSFLRRTCHILHKWKTFLLYVILETWPTRQWLVTGLIREPELVMYS